MAGQDCVGKNLGHAIRVTRDNFPPCLGPRSMVPFWLYLVRNKRTGYDLKKPNDYVGGSGGYVSTNLYGSLWFELCPRVTLKRAVQM